MDRVGPITVACALRSQLAFRRVARAIELEGGRAVSVAESEILGAAAASAIDALVYDGEAGSGSPADLVRRARATRPDWPVWLYYMPRSVMIDHIIAVASLRGVWATAQHTDLGHDAEVRRHVRRLLTSVPRVRLTCLLDSILRPLPAEVREFLEISLEHRDHGGPRAFTIRDAAANLGGQVRRLEQVCYFATGLGPKRLLDRMILVFVTFRALAFDLPLATAAGQAALTSKALNRLRHRVYGADAPAAALEPRAQFELAVIALARACRAPDQAVQEVVRQIVRESLA